MSIGVKVFLSVIISVFFGLGVSSSADARPYPLTPCGPDLAYLCPLHGSFETRPFHYDLAIYPGCIRSVYVRTRSGVKRRHELVCGSWDRQQIQW